MTTMTPYEEPVTIHRSAGELGRAPGPMSRETLSGRRLNILHIIVDQQNANAISCAGNPHVKTPNMDALIRDGVWFDRAYVPQPVCSAARASMLTGLVPSVSVRRNGDDTYRDWTEAELKDHCLGWVMRRAGYATPYAGKWHTHMMLHPVQHGYDLLNERHGGDEYSGQGPIVVSAAEEVFRGQDADPFYLTASFIQPHGICYWGKMCTPGDWRLDPEFWIGGLDPWDESLQGDGYRFPTPPANGDLREFVRNHCPPLPDSHADIDLQLYVLEWWNKSGMGGTNFNCLGRGNRSKSLTAEELWRLMAWTYYRMTETLDDEIGALIDLLKKTNRYKDTLIIYNSDHGEALGAHGLRQKNFLYEEVVRIPLAISGGAICNKGRVVRDHFVDIGLDLMPTLCDLAGVAPPSHATGQSLLPFVTGSPEVRPRPHTVIECPYGRMVRSADYAYNRYDVHGRCVEQLFDMGKNPAQTENLANSPAHKELLQRHREILNDWVHKHGAHPRAPFDHY